MSVSYISSVLKLFIIDYLFVAKLSQARMADLVLFSVKPFTQKLVNVEIQFHLYSPIKTSWNISYILMYDYIILQCWI